MSSNLVIYKDGHLFFSPTVNTFGDVMMFTTLEYWVCSQGLVIWLNQAAPAMKNYLDGKRGGIHGSQCFPKAMLLTLDGELMHLEFTLTNGVNGEDDEKFCRLMPIGEGVSWAYAGDSTYAEQGQAAMCIGKDRAHIQQLLISADIRQAERYEWHNLEELLTKVKEIHAKKYPVAAPITTPAKPKPGDARKRAHGCV